MPDADRAPSISERIESALYGSDEPQQPVAQPTQRPPQERPQGLVIEAPQEQEAGPIEQEALPNDDTEQPEPVYQTLDELASALEVSPEDFAASTKVKVKVFDDEREVTLADLQAGYQKGEAFDEKKAGLTKEKAEFAQQRAATIEKMQQQAAQTEAMAGMYKDVLLREFNSIDWQKLQTEDPIEFAEKYPAYQAKYNELLQAEQNAQEYAQQLRQQSLEARIPVEKQKLLNMIPEWHDPDAYEQGRRDIADVLKEYELDQDIVIGAIHSAGAMKLLNDLAQLRKQVKRTSEPTAQKTVVQKKTNILKPGPRKSQSDKQRSRVDQLKAKLRKTGRREDLRAVLMERM